MLRDSGSNFLSGSIAPLKGRPQCRQLLSLPSFVRCGSGHPGEELFSGIVVRRFGRTMELGRSGADADVGFRRFGAAADSTPVERSGSYGVIDNDRQILQQLRWGARLRSRRAAPGAALNDQQNLAALTWFAALTRAREAGRRDAKGGNKATGKPTALAQAFPTKNPLPMDVYAPTIGLCRDSIMMQSRRPSNSDF